MPPRLTYTIVYVPDVGAAVRFYREAFGFRVLEVEASPGWGMLDAGGHTLGFSSHELMNRFYPAGFRAVDPAEPPPGFELDIVVDDVLELEATVRRAVAAGATLVEPPRIADDGATIAFLRDPVGTIVEVQTPYRGPRLPGPARAAGDAPKTHETRDLPEPGRPVPHIDTAGAQVVFHPRRLFTFRER